MFAGIFENIENHKENDFDITQLSEILGKREFYDHCKYVDIIKAYFLVDAPNNQIQNIIKNAFLKYLIDTVYCVGKHDLSIYAPILVILLLNRH